MSGMPAYPSVGSANVYGRSRRQETFSATAAIDGSQREADHLSFVHPGCSIASTTG
ncbi:hypothetical protein N8I71_18355 [Roseibacterium sp. SDUM158016]|nr:hypothetical protein [Roseibacterium sp. SDUM158016]